MPAQSGVALEQQPGLSSLQRKLVGGLLRESTRLLVIGGHAVQAHGVARQTGDLDLWIESSPANAGRIKAGLSKVGIALHEGVDLTKIDATFSFPDPPHHEVDLHTSFAGVPAEAFVRCEGRSAWCRFGMISLPVACLQDLIWR